MGKCKAKSIHTDLGMLMHIPVYWGIFRYIQTYSAIIQGYFEPCAALAYSEVWYIQNSGIFKTRGIFRTLVYPKLWHIQNQKRFQNPGLFRALGYSELEAYSSTIKRFEKQLTNVIIFESYNYFRNISFSCRIVLVHNARSYDSQSNDARFMHKVCKNTYFV